ncbi:MAG: hypothetical protein ACRDT0_03005 [Pseudonocardiaceae bacterium]
MAALLTGQDGTLGPGHPAPDVVAFDGTGARAEHALGAAIDRWLLRPEHAPPQQHS